MKENKISNSFISIIQKFSNFELIAIFIIFFSTITLGLGSLIFSEWIWDGFVYPNIWEPVVNDAKVGDS